MLALTQPTQRVIGVVAVGAFAGFVAQAAEALLAAGEGVADQCLSAE